MYLHIGKEKNILCKEIVAVINLETSGNQEDTKTFIRCTEEKGCLQTMFGERSRTMIICDTQQNQNTTYIIPTSTTALEKRINEI